MLSSNTSAVSGDTVYVEDVFSTWLYTGNGSTQTINNGIDLSTKGGMVWCKVRDNGSIGHNLFDTSRGVSKRLSSTYTSAESDWTPNGVSAFNTNGFSVTDVVSGAYGMNGSDGTYGTKYASWTFRKQPKFFDIVTYTGNSTTGRQISHNLGSTPGCIIVKNTSTSGTQWPVYHRGIANSYLHLDATDANSSASAKYIWGDDTSFIAPTSTVFTVGGANAGYEINRTGEQYVAYIFAHDAGGFGLTGTDNVISCGSFLGNNYSNGEEVNLGWEPQWLLIKNISVAGTGWVLVDNMRGLPAAGSNSYYLQPNTSGAEANDSGYYKITSTGFRGGTLSSGSNTFIYIAIRRGPMKVPTDGTKVFSLSTWTGSSGNKDLGSQTANFGTGSLSMLKSRTAGQSWGWFDQLRGSRPVLLSDATNAEFNDGASTGGISIVNNQLQLNSGSYWGAGGDGASQNYIGMNFRRAPSFFDEVCFTMGSIPSTYTHNLGVKPEFMIAKRRSAVSSWVIYHKDLGATKYLFLPYDSAVQTNNEAWYDTEPTTTQFTVANYSGSSGTTNVWYGFATCPGVSKVGSYTGTGTTKQVDCGFAAGARFVLIKRTDSTGDWYVWDTARGIVSGNDPYLLLNTTAAEVTSTDYIDTYSAGFELSSTAPAAINASGGTFIFLAIA
jgi:hypothetical protein